MNFPCGGILPSSKQVPAMNGRCAKCFLAKSLEGMSGIIPPGPSIVGMNGNSSLASRNTVLVALMIVTRDASLKQSKVDFARTPLHSGTAATSNCQSTSRREASYRNADAAEPDSRIYISELF